VPCAQVRAAQRATSRGELAPTEASADLWRDYQGREVECFLCGGVCNTPPFSMVLPDKDRINCLALPLCEACKALPQLLRCTAARSCCARCGRRTGNGSCIFGDRNSDP
jgi:hypothetical protein